MSSVETVADLSAARLSKSYDRDNLLEDLERLKGLSFQAQLSNSAWNMRKWGYARQKLFEALNVMVGSERLRLRLTCAAN